MISVSVPGKIHLLGEHAVVYGKPALLAAVDLRVKVTITPIPSSVIPNGSARSANGSLNDSQKVRSSTLRDEPSGSDSNENLPSSEDPSPSLITQGQDDTKQKLKKIIEPIIRKQLKIKTLPPYRLTISSEMPIGAGLGSSAAISAACIAALLSFLKIKWDLNLIYNLTYEAEKVFHGNPSGADPATVIFGGLIWFRKETEDLKIIQPLSFSIPHKLAKNFILINTGKPKQTTKDMVVKVKNLYDRKPKLVNQFLKDQEGLVRQLLFSLKTSDSASMIRIIRAGERNLETIGVCSPEVKKIIRQIEKMGGAAKICGAGSDFGPTGILLCYHPKPSIIQNIAKSHNLDYFRTSLGVEGLRQE